MNRLLFLVSLLTSVVFLKAQDTIVKRDGEKIVSKVTEVNPHNIRYKRSDNPDGPIYTIEKEQVNYIVYLNGNKDFFDKYVPPSFVKDNIVTDLSIQTAGKYYYYKGFRITEPDMHAVVKRLKDPKLNAMIKTTENIKFIQDITFIVSIPVFVSGLYIFEKNQPRRGRRGYQPVSGSSQQQAQKNGATLMLAAIACDVVSVSFMFDRRGHNHLVVNAYNKQITSSEH